MVKGWVTLRPDSVIKTNYLDVLVWLRRVGETSHHPKYGIIQPGIYFNNHIITHMCIEFDRDLLFSENFYEEARTQINVWLNSFHDAKFEFRALSMKLQNIARNSCTRLSQREVMRRR